MLLGYARVSKGDDQNNVAQGKALQAAGCTRIFEEVASGGRWDRPELHRLLDQLRPGDSLVVWKLDRLSRSLKDVLHLMERISQTGAGFKSLTESIDTTTPAGRMMMHMVGAFAEFERAMIRERTRAGLASARSEGRLGGRPRALDAAQAAAAVEDVRSGKRTIADTARLWKVSAPTISRLVSRAQAEEEARRLAQAPKQRTGRAGRLKPAARPPEPGRRSPQKGGRNKR